MFQDLLDGWIGLRARWRGYGLPIFASPLVLAGLIAAIGGDEQIVLGAALGFGASLLAARRLRRGRTGDANRAAWLMAVGTGLAAHFAADLGTIFPFVMAGGALLGTRLMYQALPEAAPPPPPEPPPPPPAPPGPIEESRARLARIESAAQRLADPRLRGVAQAMEGVLDDLTARPDRLPMARRFLTVQLDGVERIVQRLEAGAAPPAALPPLLEELTRTATELRSRIAREETEALEIQVKVLSDRLREEGYR
ncbi:hypothetical protein [Paracraurococcus lichenis]|uniref:FUSC family protein n=1 Tax=Paracraurococcus lichenis TaxID=3064888 RepID=A0ABT9E5U3_9PROT|nr:hypothetical protein [Paracraurococcus sp. LOR1-02]MDO9711534.1 hypothetical protein [Paracraurococcus sp. LOR1-02]